MKKKVTKSDEKAQKNAVALYHISTDLTDKAVTCIEEILTNRSINSQVRLSAARDILDRAGVSAKAQESVRAVDSLGDLSTAELRAIVAGASSAISDRAKTVNTPHDDEGADYPVELFD